MSGKENITLEMVMDLVEPILSQSLDAVAQRPIIARTLSDWLQNRSRFESNAALELADYHLKFLLNK